MNINHRESLPVEEDKVQDNILRFRYPTRYYVSDFFACENIRNSIDLCHTYINGLFIYWRDHLVVFLNF